MLRNQGSWWASFTLILTATGLLGLAQICVAANPQEGAIPSKRRSGRL